VISWLLYLIGMTVAAITRNERYHQFYSLFIFAQSVTFSFLLFHTLAQVDSKVTREHSPERKPPNFVSLGLIAIT